MLGPAQARQVRVDGGDERAFVAEVDLDLAEVLALLEQVCGVRVAQTVNVGGLLTPLEWSASRKARCSVVRHIGSVAVAAPCPL